MDCIKKQVEMRKGVEQHRCLHKDADTYRELVTENVCAACPLRVARPTSGPIEPIVQAPQYRPPKVTQLWLEYGEITERPIEYQPATPSEGDGFGDWVQQRLEAVGVTKERWIAAKETVGLPPVCNCEERQEWLNEVGHKFGQATRKIFSKIWSK